MQKKLLFFQRRPWRLLLTASVLLLLWGYHVPAQGQSLTASLFDDKPVMNDPDQDHRKKSLKDVISILEELHSIKITYQSDIVVDKFIDESDYKKILDTSKGKLEDVVQSYISPMGLGFKQYKDNYYIIKRQDELPKIQKKLLPDNKSSALPAIEKMHRKSVLSHIIQRMERTISGQVTDENSEPLPGVNIVVKNTITGTVTDVDGNYRLSVSDDATTLVFSSVGYITEEVDINGRAVINLQMTTDIQSLDEIVVVGYGVQKRSDLTGSVASVPRDRLEISPNINISQAIQGAVSGVMVQTTSAGAAPSETLMIRGRNSINADNTPLIVVDGISYGGNISDINPADVESIEVLKDASASAIYGARGANGVILITTKKGTDGEPILSYNSHVSFQRYANLPDVMNGEEFLKFREERFPGVVTQSEIEVLEAGKSVDWMELGLRNGLNHEHNLSISGAVGKTSYYLSGGYIGVQGITVNDDFQRFTGRINVDAPIKDWLTIGTRTQLSSDDRSGVSPSQSGLFYMNPNSTPYDEEGNLTIYPWPEDPFFGNPLAPILYDDTNTSDQVLSNSYILIDFPFVEGLSYRFNAGFRNRTTDQSTYRGRNTAAGFEARGSTDISRGRFVSNVYENIISFNREIGVHSIFATGVFSYESNKNTINSLSAFGFPNDFLSFYATPQADASIPNFSNYETTLLSQMLRLNYAYDSRYLLTLTGRRDGFSGFGEDTKWGFFPSVAIAWNLANEDFFPWGDVINMMKPRISFGSNGNHAIGAYESLSTLSSNDFIHQSETQAGFFPTRLGQENLGWEESKTLNIGLDIGLFENRIHGEINYFRTNTTDLLLNRTISSVHGITSIIQNIGETKNTGFELSAHSRNIQKNNFIWNTSGNMSIIKNQIVDLYGNDLDDIANAWFIGQPINVNFDFVVDGVWQLDEADEAATWGSQPGFVKLRDVNGDGRLTAAEDRQIIGQQDPKMMWGLTNTFSYKEFTLYIFIHGIHGVTRQNPLKTDNDTFAQVRQNTTKKNWWTPENPTNDFVMNHLNAEIMSGIGGRGGSRIWWYENAGFVRIKDISLSYDVPVRLTEKLGLIGLRFYAVGRNQFTFTKWGALDPELSSQRAIPLQKEFVLGVDLKF